MVVADERIMPWMPCYVQGGFHEWYTIRAIAKKGELVKAEVCCHKCSGTMVVDHP